MKTKFISIVLSFFMCVALCSCGDKSSVPAVVIDDGTETDEYVYTGNGTSAWCSSLLEGPATDYNNKLAIVAAEMSDAAENDNGDDKTIRGKFSEYSLYACEYYNFDGTSLFSAGGAFAIGQDTLTINGVNTTVLVVVARGTKNLQESIGDLFKGGEDDFLNTKVWNNVYDFEKKILNGVNDYITKYPAIRSAEHLKILVTGHSLGGAAANMFGARLTYGVGSGEWWGSKLSKDDIYVYTFGAIKVLTTEDNVNVGYENIHNIYNYYDSYGPNGNQKGTNASSPNAKFGHTEVFTFINREETGPTIFDSCNNHIMSAYQDALKAVEEGSGSINLACSGWAEPPLGEPDVGIEITPEAQGPTEPPAKYEDVPAIDSFTIEGSWKSVGSYGFGQAQPGAIVAFDGTHCNFFSPYDTYALYQDDGQWKLDCTSFLFSETLTFKIEIIDADSINVYYGSNCTELSRIS